MNKAARRKLHAAINDLTNAQVATIVKQAFPRKQGARIDALAKAVIADTHRKVSPRARDAARINSARNTAAHV